MNRKAKKQAGKQDQEGEAGVGTAHLLEVDFFTTTQGRGNVTQRGHIYAMNPFFAIHIYTYTCTSSDLLPYVQDLFTCKCKAKNKLYLIIKQMNRGKAQ